MKNNKIKKIALIVLPIVVVIALTGFMAFYINYDKEKPEDILKKYMSLITEKDYDAMYELTNKSTEKELFITRNKNIYEGIEASKVSIKVVKTTKSIKGAEVHYNEEIDTIAGTISFINTANMEKSGDSYKIIWSSKLIFPDLKSEYKVRVSTLEGERGNILDRDGNLLAGKQTVSQIGFVPGRMNQASKEQDIQTIAQILEVSADSIKSSLSAKYVEDDTFVPIKTVLKSDTEIKQQVLQVQGIKIIDKEERVYSLGEVTAHLLGYVQTINADELENKKSEGYVSSSVIGKSGIEKIFESRLRGISGAEIYLTDENGNKIKTLAKREHSNGKDIRLTIDSALQQKLYDVYKDEKSANIIINPKTGEILAAVSTPTFDSNDFSLGMSNNKWKSLSESTDRPLYNRFYASYPPGSSFKPVTGAVGLTSGSFTADENFGKSGNRWQKDSSWKNFYVSTLATYSGPANLRNALVYSDNIYFAKAAIKIGKDNFANGLKNLGFNQEVKTGLQDVRSSFSNTDSFNSETQLANSGYGQAEVLVNPLHMAMVYSAFVNNGNMINTYIEYKENPEVTYYKENAFSQDAANTIKEDLIQVIEDRGGTAHSIKTEGLILAGKTGTAEIKASKDDKNGREIGWFNCFIADDASERQLLIISMIEDVKDKGGSHYVVDKVKNIIQ